MLTGLDVCDHGIVANGWYNHDMSEIQFWKQSNKLVRGDKVWDAARRIDPSITTLNMFWWYNMYSSADYSVTPRPMYKADGRKIPDCYSNPGFLRDELQEELGTFPLFNFWGPATSIKATRWIADATMRLHEKLDTNLTLEHVPVK
jgi:predicted AlkP superfamily pyrophosphatase or phosphodiesterase